MKIAVCIPTWNRANTLSFALDSLINQKTYPFDIHIFDNASTDSTEEVVVSYNNSRIFYHKNLTNIGFVGNINRCLGLTQNYDWIGILHSDDCHFGESVATVVQYIKKYPDAGIIFSKYHQMNSNGEIYKEGTGEETIWKAGLQAIKQCQSQIPCSSTFYKSEAIMKMGLYDNQFPYSADEEYGCRLATKYDIVETKEILAGYRRHEGHMMIKTWCKKDFIQTFEKMRIVMAQYAGLHKEEAISSVQKNLAEVFKASAVWLAATGNWYPAFKFHSYAFIHNPQLYSSWKSIIHAFLQSSPFIGKVFYRSRCNWD